MKALFFCFWTFVSFSALSQSSSIEPVVGYDFSSLRHKNLLDRPGFVDTYIYDNALELGSLLFGIKGNHSLTEKLFISATFGFTRKKVNASTTGFVPFEGFQFNYFQNSLSLNYTITSHFYAGFGGNLNLLTNFRYTLRGEARPEDEFITRYYDYGISCSAGAIYRNINWEIYYFHSFTSMEDRSGLWMKPIQSFGVKMGYRINFKNRF